MNRTELFGELKSFLANRDNSFPLTLQQVVWFLLCVEPRIVQHPCLKSCFAFRCFFTTVSITSEVTSTSACECVAIEVSVGLSKLMECLVDDTDKEFVKHNVTQVCTFKLNKTK